MAAAGLRDKLICSVCREIYTEPVTLQCGHNFCLRCIERTWEEQREKREDPSCPECGEKYTHKLQLKRNLTLCYISEQFRSTAAEQEGPRSNSESTQPTTSSPTSSLMERNCHIHKMTLEYYCPEDGICICSSCSREGDHEGHEVELLSEASEKKKEKLREVLEKLSPERGETEGQIQRLQERRNEMQEKAAGETERVTDLFRDIRKWLVALEERLLSDISREQEKVSHKLHDLIQQLEIKKNELSRKIHHIEELCNMADPLTVLQERESHGAEFYGAEGGDRKRRKMEEDPAIGDLDVGPISKSLLTGLEEIVTGFKGKWFPGQEATDLVLDINTAGDNVCVVIDGKKAFYSGSKRDYPYSRGRFQIPQVLSTKSFSSGRHYWDVVVSASKSWRVGVAYPSITRGWEGSRIGDNKKSWRLYLRNNKYYVVHDKKSTELPYVPSCERIRISLEYEAGHLSFYELSEPIRHLHTFTAKFTEPLHAAFAVEAEGSVRIIS